VKEKNNTIPTKGDKMELRRPKRKSLEEVREIRDEIQERINELVAEITTITPTER
jgi:hypothetical protein